MRNQLEGVDAVGAVLGGGGDPIARMQGGVRGRAVPSCTRCSRCKALW